MGISDILALFFVDCCLHVGILSFKHAHVDHKVSGYRLLACDCAIRSMTMMIYGVQLRVAFASQAHILGCLGALRALWAILWCLSLSSSEQVPLRRFLWLRRIDASAAARTSSSLEYHSTDSYSDGAVRRTPCIFRASCADMQKRYHCPNPDCRSALGQTKWAPQVGPTRLAKHLQAAFECGQESPGITPPLQLPSLPLRHGLLCCLPSLVVLLLVVLHH
jgi:hypothetical protein